jgi:hypothetical protein
MQDRVDDTYCARDMRDCFLGRGSWLHVKDHSVLFSHCRDLNATETSLLPVHVTAFVLRTSRVYISRGTHSTPFYVIVFNA